MFERKEMLRIKKRRARRKYINWEAEIAKGNTDRFYNSTDWDILREEVLKRDKGKCQFFLRCMERWKAFSRQNKNSRSGYCTSYNTNKATTRFSIRY